MKTSQGSRGGVGAPPQMILLAEPAPALRERLAVLLAEVPGVSVAAEAASVAEALELLRQAPFDAVVLDLDLGRGEALWALEQIRREARGALVVLSSDGDPELRQRCRQLGADAFLVTSLEFERIGDTLLDLAGRKADRAGGGGR